MLTSHQKRYVAIKRMFDCLFAIGLLTVLSPIVLLAAIWIKVDSRGPVIFTQRRPGKKQKIFTIYKLRTMSADVTKDGIAVSDTDRLTTPGKILRKTSIDEIPQLWNVIRGDMSLIGPRPFLINDLESYTEDQLARFEVLPGMSSWTAIHGRANLTFEEKANYEIHYVRNIGPKIDFEIFCKTVWLVLSCRNVDDTENKNAKRIAAEIRKDAED